jgi:hypothetical protein
MPAPDKIAMENVNSPGRVARVDADKYGSAQETDCIPLTEYCRVFLGQRRGARRLESIQRVVAATVG